MADKVETVFEYIGHSHRCVRVLTGTVTLNSSNLSSSISINLKENVFVLSGYGIYLLSKRYNLSIFIRATRSENIKIVSLLDETYSISTQNKQISSIYFVYKWDQDDMVSLINIRRRLSIASRGRYAERRHSSSNVTHVIDNMNYSCHASWKVRYVLRLIHIRQVSRPLKHISGCW